jgi:hypothetical protein
MDDSVPGQLSARLLYLELLAHRAHGSAYFVVARRGKAPPFTSPQHGGARFPTLAAVYVVLSL